MSKKSVTRPKNPFFTAYDDVERKTREMVEPAQAMRKLVPDEERQSLSTLYEQEYLQVFGDFKKYFKKFKNTFRTIKTQMRIRLGRRSRSIWRSCSISLIFSHMIQLSIKKRYFIFIEMHICLVLLRFIFNKLLLEIRLFDLANFSKPGVYGQRRVLITIKYNIF